MSLCYQLTILLLLFASIYSSNYSLNESLCVYQCIDRYSCNNNIIDCTQCLSQQICQIICIGDESCNDLHIISIHNIKINLQCKGENSCKNINFINKKQEEDINNNNNYKNENILSFICECIPSQMYNIYKTFIIDMFNYLKEENYWLYSLTHLLNQAINIRYLPQLIYYHIKHDLHYVYINDDDDDQYQEQVTMDYIIPDLLKINDCQYMNKYVLSQLKNIENDMDIICIFNNIKYKLLDYVGFSSYVYVIKAINLEQENNYNNNNIVIIKFFDLKSSECDNNLLIKEINGQKLSNIIIPDTSIKIINHSNITKIKDYDIDYGIIIMEYIDNGDVSKYIKYILQIQQKEKQLQQQEEFANFMICRLLDDISFSLNIISNYDNYLYLHNDIKPANIFIFNLNSMLFKLGDFGHMMELKYILNISNDIVALGTPNYIALSMSDLMLNLYSENQTIYEKAKNIYLKYPIHADLYQLLSSILSLYNTICDKNYIYNGDTMSICKLLNDKKLNLDINAENSNSSFIEYFQENRSKLGLLYVLNSQRFKRIDKILLNYKQETKNNKLFHFIAKYINSLYNDYKNDNIDNNKPYLWSMFRNGLNNICKNQYLLSIRNNNNNDYDKNNRFKYQIWQYDKDKNPNILLKEILDDLNDSCYVNNIIIYNRATKDIIYPRHDEITDIHVKLENKARAFNKIFYREL